MDESEFVNLADQALADIENALEACAADIDIELQPGGVIELCFEDDSKVIINRHVAAREIWIAARSGGFHFRPDNGGWVNTRDAGDLYAMLSRVVSEQSGSPVTVSPPA